MVNTGTVVTGQQISELRSPKELPTSWRRLLPALRTQETLCLLVQRRMATSPHFVLTEPPEPTKSHLMVRRIMRLTAESVFHHPPMPCRNLKFKQIPSTRSKVTRQAQL